VVVQLRVCACTTVQAIAVSVRAVSSIFSIFVTPSFGCRITLANHYGDNATSVKRLSDGSTVYRRK
jgi:hypothetical protein